MGAHRQLPIKRQAWRAMMAGSLLLLSLGGCLRVVPMQAADAHVQPRSPATSSRLTDRPIAQSMNAVSSNLLDANRRFSFKLFAAILKQQQNQNVFVSPSSVAFALSMVYNGANGETQQAMAKALEIQGMSLDELNHANAELKALLGSADPDVQLAIANSLWVRQGVAFKPDFIQRNRQFYAAHSTELDFRDSRAVATINDWVSDHTRGKIRNIIDQISPQSVMFLINAIYFKGNWSRKFDRAQTIQAPFQLANGSSKSHPMMMQRGDYRYGETEQFQAVSLPYGKTRRLSMVVVLPKPKVGLAGLYLALDADHWQQVMEQLRNRPGTIQIPRFKLNYDVELSGILSTLGMVAAFGNQADFSGISQTPTQISEVKHKTFVDVNEEGTEAAAVTSVGIRATAVIMPQEPFQMVVNRPFFCAIQDNQTGAILFMGSIIDPGS